jgi:uncharacterized protein (DUF58 family)
MAIDIESLSRFSNIEFLAKQVVEGFITGMHRSPFHGFSVEFAEHRPYRSGETTRFIDWKLYGRTDKMFVKRFEEETNLRCHLVVDQSASMFFPDRKHKPKLIRHKAAFSAMCAAALSEVMRRQRDASGLMLFDEEVRTYLPAKMSQTHQRILFHHLEPLLSETPPLHRTGNPAKVMHDLAERLPRRSLVAVFSDFMGPESNDTEEILDAIRHLRHQKHETLLFHVVDETLELDFNLPNRPFRFVDLETGLEVKAMPAAVKEQYISAMKKRTESLSLGAAKYGATWISADINRGFEEVLWAYFIHRQKTL